MKVKVLFFATLREQLGRSQEDVELPKEIDSVEKLRTFLLARGGGYEKIFSGKFLVRAAVNQDMVQPGAPIKAGDEVAFFPPVTGG